MDPLLVLRELAELGTIEKIAVGLDRTTGIWAGRPGSEPLRKGREAAQRRALKISSALVVCAQQQIRSA